MYGLKKIFLLLVHMQNMYFMVHQNSWCW